MRELGAWLDEQRDSYLLGLARIAFSLLFAHNAGMRLRGALEYGYFGDFFHIPLLPESFLPSRSLYVALLVLEILAALVAASGWFARPLLLLAASVGLYLFCCNRLDYHNNRYVLHLMVFLLPFTPCDRSFRLFGDKLDANQRRAPFWAQRLMQVQIWLVYVASAGSKLLDSDWRGGQVLSVRYASMISYSAEHGRALPEWVTAALSSPAFAEATSKAAIFTELFVAFGLWFPRTRAPALWLGLLLHFGIEVGARVELFSFLMWASYLLFCVPELAERKLIYDSTQKSSRAFARVVRALDWLKRFEVVPSSEASSVHGLSTVDRDGRVSSGFGAFVLVTRALPALFPMWLPLAAARSLLGAARSAP